MTSTEPVAHRGIITLAVMMATVMQVLDTTIVNVALPYIQGSLAVSQDMVVWVLTSYIAAAAVLTPATGFLSGLWGRKRVYLLAVGGFTIASILCGASQSIVEIVLFRVLQGVFGAALVPLSQATMLDIYPPERHGEAMAIWGTGIMVGPVIGPTLGGYLTDYLNWRWVFYINVPIGLLALLLIWLYVPEETPEKPRPFDGLGFLLFGIGIIALQVMLDRGELNDWLSHPETQIELGLVIFGFYTYFTHALTTPKTPYFNLRVFQDWNVTVGNLLMFVAGALLYATLSLLPPMLHDLMGYPVATAGLVLAPRGGGTFISMMLSGLLVSRVDPRALLVLGFILAGGGLMAMRGYDLYMGSWTVMWSGFIQGLGLGFIFVPLATIAFATVPQELRTDASSVFNLMRSLGGSFGISIVTSVLVRRGQMHHEVLGANINPGNPHMQAPQLPPVWNPLDPHGAAALNAELTRQSAMLSYMDTFHLLMVLSAISIVLTFTLRKPEGFQANPMAGLE
jgi:DHA2 family multidrug resistance protein